MNVQFLGMLILRSFEPAPFIVFLQSLAKVLGENKVLYLFLFTAEAYGDDVGVVGAEMGALKVAGADIYATTFVLRYISLQGICPTLPSMNRHDQEKNSEIL